MDEEARSRFGTVERWIDALRSAEGFYPGAEGFRIGSTRLFEKLVSHAGHDDEYHLHQRDEDGTESDLTGARSIQGIPVSETDPTTTQILGYNATTNEWTPTAAGAAAAHKDAHDPQDGADPLDTANAAAITGVVGAGTGTSHSFARADHIHAISHSIADNKLVTVDGTTNTPANLDYAKWTTLGLEGKTYTQLRADINVADGADVTGDNTPKAHGLAQHTTGYNTWKVIYTDASGDQQEIAVGADGTVFTGTGAASAPAFEAADEHAHANDHAEVHGIAAHTEHAAWKALYTDASGDEQELALGADGEVFTSTGAAGVPAFEAAGAGGIPTELEDDDEDTGWRAEQAADEDKLRGRVGATERHLIQTASPHHTLTGDAIITGGLQLQSTAALAAGKCLKIAPSAVPGGGNALYGIEYAPSGLTGLNLISMIALTPDACGIATAGSAYGLHCIAAIRLAAGAAAGNIYGLYFSSAVSLGGDSAVLTNLYGVWTRVAAVGFTGTITNSYGLRVNRVYEVAGNPFFTNYYGIYVDNGEQAEITNQYLLYLEDATNATTINYIIESPYLRLKGSGSWTAAANETPLWLACDDPATLQQVTCGAADSGGVGFRVLRVPN